MRARMGFSTASMEDLSAGAGIFMIGQFDMEEEFYNQAPESGCRKAEPVEEFDNSSYPSGRGNNGRVLAFETGEDLRMVQQVLERHRNNIFLDAVKGVGCVDQFMEASKVGKKVSFTPPTYQYHVGNIGVFTSSVVMVNAKVTVEGGTKAEGMHQVVQALLRDQTPENGNFICLWFYHRFSSEVNTMAGSALEHILEMLPLQIPLVMEAVYMVYSSILKTFSVSHFSSPQQLPVTESVLTKTISLFSSNDVSTKPRLSTEGVMKTFTVTKNMSQFNNVKNAPPPYDVSNIKFQLLLQSNDIEVNPGPKNTHVKNEQTSSDSENFDDVDIVQIETQRVREKWSRP